MADKNGVQLSKSMIPAFPFRYKLTLLITLIIIPLITAVFYLVQFNVETEFRKLIERQLQQAETYVSKQMDDRYDHLYSNATILASDELLRIALSDKSLDRGTRNDIVVDEVYPKLTNIDFMLIADTEGAVIGDSGVEEALIDEVMRAPWLLQYALEGEEAFGYIFMGSQYYQIVALPSFIGSQMIGVVIVGRSLSKNHLVDIKKTSYVDISVLHDNNIVLSTQWDSKDDAYSPGEYVKALQEWMDAGNSLPYGELTEVTLYKERFLMRANEDTAQFVPVYIVVQSLDKRLVFLDDIRKNTVVIGGVGTVIGFLIGFLFSVGISRPIRMLQDATREIEQENFGYSVKISTLDEFSLLGNSFNSMIEGLAEKKRIRNALDKSVSTEVANHMLEADVKLGGKKKKATILFSDIRGFTTLSEKLDENDLITLLNAYLTSVSQSIQKQSGTIDKFIGDAVMALFGVPVPRPSHALDAVVAALEMSASLQSFNEEVASDFGCEIAIGIGINTGTMVAGFVGSEDRLNYTVLGDEVNLSSRLEGLTKYYGVSTIISEATHREIQQLDDPRKDGLVFRELDNVQVKGKTVGVRIYEVLSLKDYDEKLPERLMQFQDAQKSVRKGNLEHALHVLEGLHAAWPDDGATKALLTHTREYMEDREFYRKTFRNGVHVFDHK